MQHAERVFPRLDKWYKDFSSRQSSLLHPDLVQFLEFRYHHLLNILSAYPLRVRLNCPNPCFDDVEPYLQSAIKVVTWSLNYSAAALRSIQLNQGHGNANKSELPVSFSWLCACKFHFEFAVDCILGVCSYFEKRGFAPEYLKGIRTRILHQQSIYTPISHNGLCWLESGLSDVINRE